jgi:hypothetical protein
VVAVTRTVTLGDRGRVPFALVGVLLVVASALFAAGIGPHSRPPEPAVDLTMERTAADTRAALRQAATSAAVAAASEPVLTPANTSYGRVVRNGSGSAFENALRIRIYLAARERFQSVERRHRGVTGSVSLPRPTTPDELARARDRVVVGEGEDGPTSLRVTIRNVTRTATDGGQVVGRRTGNITVEVDSPILAVHERVQTFQERLDAGLLKPGLTQKLTARLYPVAWARGYAQYGGAPIENVVSNQHVSLLTNGGVLGVQRSVFGESDPDGRRAHRAAIAEEALTSITGRAPDSVAPLGELLKQQLVASTTVSERRGIANLGENSSAPTPDEKIDVDVGQTALEAFRPFTCRPEEYPAQQQTMGELCTIDGSMRNVVNYTVQQVYSARVRTIAATNHVSRGNPTRPEPPDEAGSWVLEDATVERDVTAVQATTEVPSVTVPERFHALFTYDRRVTVRYSHVAVWRDASNRSIRRHTYTNETGTTRVSVAVVGQHAPTTHAPNRTVETVHEPYPGAGRNLADIRERVEDQVVDDRGGPDDLAGAAAVGRLSANAERVFGDRPSSLPEQAYLDLAELRGELRAVNVSVPRGQVGTYEVNPAAQLAANVSARREKLVRIPESYDSVAHKARVELRAMYVDRVIAKLEARARRHSDQEQGFADAIASAGDVSLGTLRNGTEARRVDGGGGTTDGAATDLRFRVDGAPPYLTMAEVTHSAVAAVPDGESVYPLKAENINVFTIPYGDATKGAVDWVAGALSSEPQTQLRTGATAIGAADSAVEATENESIAAAREDLTGQVEQSLREVRWEIRLVLVAQDVANTSEQRREIVDAAFARWDDPRARALAVANRTVIDAVVAEAVAHEATSLDDVDRDILRIGLRNTVTATLDTKGGTVSGPVVATATEQVRGAVGNYTRDRVSSAVEEKFNTSINAIPAGLPIAPVPGYWAVTANVWVVNVHGGYERFAVETPRRTPAPGDASLAYVRDGKNVTLDVDGDGATELLGRSDEVNFSIQTAIVVVVPAGGTGVGDIDGKLRERSPGWKRLGGDENGTRQPALVRSHLTLNDYVEVATTNKTVRFGRSGPQVVSNGTRARPATAESRGNGTG